VSTSEHWTTIALITLALITIVPLALVPARSGPGRARLALAGVLAAMSFLPPPSVVAAAIVLPWLLVVASILRRTPTLPASGRSRREPGSSPTEPIWTRSTSAGASRCSRPPTSSWPVAD
jgi:hypothetical protein